MRIRAKKIKKILLKAKKFLVYHFAARTVLVESSLLEKYLFLAKILLKFVDILSLGSIRFNWSE